MKIVSFGGGVQSTALLVLAAEGKVDYTTFVFCNVGDDSENPDTITYVRDVATPYAEAHGIKLITLQRKMRNGETATLYSRLMRDSRTIDIPVRMANGAPGNRACTNDFKRGVIAKWCKQQGATEASPAIVALGISMDEYQRMRTDSGVAFIKNTYPLIDLRMNRQQCREVIEHAGLPVPPKSSCWFCPYMTRAARRDQKHDAPELFQKTVELEQVLNLRREKLGKDHIFFSSTMLPLDLAVAHNQLTLDDMEGGCESGYCMV
jgi:PP-loop superfamily ATP-utilizing enzyme